MNIKEYNDLMKWIDISKKIIKEEKQNTQELAPIQEPENMPQEEPKQNIETFDVYNEIRNLVAREISQIKNKETIDKILTTIAQLVNEYNPDRDTLKKDQNKKNKNEVEVDKQDLSQSEQPQDFDQAKGMDTTSNIIPTNTGTQDTY